MSPQVDDLARAADGVLHDRGGPLTRWTTVNMGEVQPGVLTPLNWSFWRHPSEAGVRAGYADIGVLSRSEVAPPSEVDRRVGGIFYGRYAGNLSFLCEVSDRMPGGSSEALEQQIFGHVAPGIERRRSRSRYPAVTAKLPLAVARARRRSGAIYEETRKWWAGAIGDPGDALPRMVQGQRHLERALRTHMTVTLLAQGSFDALAKAAAAAGHPGLERDLSTGFGGMEEARVGEDLWRVSRGELPLEVFLERHGFHGPAEGELSSRVWREEPAPLLELCEGYRRMPREDAPAAQAARQVAKRAEATRALIAATPPSRRTAVKLLIGAVARYLPLREVGKASFLMAIDGARAGARDLGAALARQGRLDDPEDVFLLTLEELERGVGSGAKSLIADRRVLRDQLRALELPERWTGDPVPTCTRQPDDAPSTVTGVPVSSGVAQGRARVITDPARHGEFDPGDILVCHTTDPSWVVYFQLAGAVVIDVGGPLSHGAIVARELGLPAVINTRNGTRDIPDGALIRVDGSTGTVTTIPTEGETGAA